MSQKTRLAAGVSLAFVAILFACTHDEPPPATPILVPLDPKAASDAAVMTGAIDGGPSSVSVDAASIDTRPVAAFGDGGHPGDAASEASTRDFYTCTTDPDCVPVPKVGCCSNGYKEAVNKDSATAYLQSFTCPTPNQKCPHFVINDTRVAECSNVTHKCEMVAIDQIRCGGESPPNPHLCPADYKCAVPHMPADAMGHCTK